MMIRARIVQASAPERPRSRGCRTALASPCLAALRQKGYRSSHRYVVFQVLPHTLGLGPEVWRVLARCHEIRNRGEYEGDMDVDERLVTDLIAACKRVATALDALPPLR